MFDVLGFGVFGVFFEGGDLFFQFVYLRGEFGVLIVERVDCFFGGLYQFFEVFESCDFW